MIACILPQFFMATWQCHDDSTGTCSQGGIGLKRFEVTCTTLLLPHITATPLDACLHRRGIVGVHEKATCV